MGQVPTGKPSELTLGYMPETLIPAQLVKLRQQQTAPLILELDLTDGIAESRPADPVSES